MCYGDRMTEPLITCEGLERAGLWDRADCCELCHEDWAYPHVLVYGTTHDGRRYAVCSHAEAAIIKHLGKVTPDWRKISAELADRLAALWPDCTEFVQICEAFTAAFDAQLYGRPMSSGGNS